MKLYITLKDPDGFSDSLDEAITESTPENLISDERDTFEERKDKVKEVLAKWFEYEEYVTIEVDTVKGTARVVPVND